MYLKIEHPCEDLPAFALVRAKAAAEEVLARAGLTLPELAAALEAGRPPASVSHAAEAAAAALVASGHDGAGVVLVVRKVADAACATS